MKLETRRQLSRSAFNRLQRPAIGRNAQAVEVRGAGKMFEKMRKFVWNRRGTQSFDFNRFPFVASSLLPPSRHSFFVTIYYNATRR